MAEIALQDLQGIYRLGRGRSTIPTHTIKEALSGEASTHPDGLQHLRWRVDYLLAIGAFKVTPDWLSELTMTPIFSTLLRDTAYLPTEAWILAYLWVAGSLTFSEVQDLVQRREPEMTLAEVCASTTEALRTLEESGDVRVNGGAYFGSPPKSIRYGS